MATWPSTLPKPRTSGYQLSPVDPALRSDMEVGAARVRRRTAARNDQVSVAWFFTDAQLATFRTWYDDAAGAAGGASWFDGLSLAIGNTGVTAQSARFVGIWKADQVDKLQWSVSAKLELR